MEHPKLTRILWIKKIRHTSRVHLGIAVALEDGLIVPVIRDADRKELMQVHSELQDLQKRARIGRLRPHESLAALHDFQPGMYGIEGFTAILNPPEVEFFGRLCL